MKPTPVQRMILNALCRGSWIGESVHNDPPTYRVYNNNETRSRELPQDTISAMLSVRWIQRSVPRAVLEITDAGRAAIKDTPL